MNKLHWFLCALLITGCSNKQSWLIISVDDAQQLNQFNHVWQLREHLALSDYGVLATEGESLNVLEHHRAEHTFTHIWHRVKADMACGQHASEVLRLKQTPDGFLIKRFDSLKWYYHPLTPTAYLNKLDGVQLLVLPDWDSLQQVHVKRLTTSEQCRR